jgi:DnaK suppressor protein
MTVAEEFRQRLLRERAELLAGVRQKVQALSAAERVSEDEQAQRLHDDFVRLRLNAMDVERLRLVNEALDRIQAGDYGVCLNCDQPIPPKRLDAVPWARYCVKCQEEVADASPEEPTEDLLEYLRSPVHW